MKTAIIAILVLFLAACVQIEETKPFKLGAPLPLTGSNAFYGDFTKYGIELAVEDINKAGGINGRTVQVIYEDTAGDKTKATTAAQKLIHIDGVDALITSTTPMSGAISPVAEENRIPLIYASATNSFTINKTYVFKDYTDAAGICELLMKQVKKDGHEKVAVFGTDAEFTQLCKKGAEKVGKLNSFEVYPGGETDFKTQFAKIKNAENTALILSVFAGDCPHAYKQIRELGLKAKLYTAFQSFACGSADNTKANADLLEGAYGADVALDEESDDPDFLAFKKRLDERGWTTQIRGSAIMYDSTMEFAKAFQDCQDALCVANNLRALQMNGISGHISYGGDQIVEREIMLVKYENGKWRKVQ